MKNPFSNIKGFFGSLRSKYIEIILAVGLFIILDTGVLIINFYTSYQIAGDAHAIQLASRMGTLTQVFLQQLYAVRDDAENPAADHFATIDIFAKSYKMFDETLDSFIYGGKLIGEGQGQDALLEDTAYRDAAATLLKEAEVIWKVYRVKLKPIVYAYFEDAEREDIIEEASEAIAYARLHNEKLLEIMEQFASAVEGVAQSKAQRLRLIQSVGISLAIINFFLILFHFLRRLGKSDALVAQSKKETENILENVNEGLFLIDKNYIIGSQHSDSLHTLFNQTSFENTDFLELLRPLVTERTLAMLKDYTDILFSPRVEESLVTDLNPLNRVELHLATENAQFDIRYFSFQFSRVYEKTTFRQLLVTVRDITEQVELEEQLKAANAKAAREVDMLLSIMHVDDASLSEYLTDTRHGLRSVNNILKNPAEGSTQLKAKIETILRIIHKLKGDSAAVGIAFLEEKFHGYEDTLAALRKTPELTGERFLPLVIQLNQLLNDFNTICSLYDKISQHHPDDQAPGRPTMTRFPSATPPATPPMPQLHAQLTRLTRRIAAHYQKEAALNLDRFDVSGLRDDLQATIKDITVQCLRNAVAHGLESPQEREALGKPRQGEISAAITREGPSLRLSIRDDGRGIDLALIRDKAIASGLATKEQVARWAPPRLLSIIFHPGFSTSEKPDRHAGRGVGLDIIKNRLEDMGGRVKICYRQGRYTEFVFLLGNERPLARTA
ncbi:MAG: ATP-binding protein [Pseudomonadota bacterium]